MVVCVSGAGNISGAVVVRAGGVLKICQATLTGSITVDPAWGPLPGGKLIKSTLFIVTGAINNMGGTVTLDDLNACDFVNPCTAPSAGSLTTPSPICAGTQTGIDGSAVASVTYAWEKENTLNANDWVAIGGNTEDLAAGTIGNLTTTTRFRRKTSACSPVQSSAWITVTITVNSTPTIVSTTPASRCGSGTLNLIADVSSGATVNWYTSSSGGSSIGTSADNASWTTPNISSTTTYYAEALNGSCASSTRTAAIATINNNPTIDLDLNNLSGKTGNDFQFTYTEKSVINNNIADTDLTLGDVDNANLASATIVLTNKQTGDYFTWGSLPSGMSITADSSVANKITLNISGSATILNYQNFIKGIKFNNGASNPNTTLRNITFNLSDGSCSSTTASTSITFTAVNDAPILDLDALGDSVATGFDYKTTYQEQKTGITIGNNKSNGVTITDADNTTLTGATIVLTNTKTADVFVVSNSTTLTSLGITATVSTSGANTYIKFSGTTTLANYQTAIKLIQFSNTADNPDQTTRLVKVRVFDGTDSSNTANTTIVFKALNDCPTLTNASNYATTYTENGAKVSVVNTTFSITDPDLATALTTQAWTATIQLTNGVTLDSIFAPASANGFTVAAPVYAYPNVTVSITGTGTADNLTSLVKAITYKTGSENPSTTARTVTIAINDGTCAGNGNSTISITNTNDCPTLTNASNFSTSFTENGAKVAVVNTTFSITDSDLATVSTTQAFTATIQLTNGLTLDSLFAPASANGFIVATPVYAYPNVTVSITGTGTATNLATLIKAITYKSGSDNPSTTARTVSIIVKDADVLCSGSGNSTISITTTNDCPVLSNAANYSTSFTENGAKVAVANSTFSISDNDLATASTTQAWTATIQLINGLTLDSLFAPASANGFTVATPIYAYPNVTVTITGTGTATNLATLVKAITYKSGSDNPSTTTRTVSISINDGNCPGTGNTTISISNVNDCPIIDLNTTTLGNNDVVTYIENASAVNIIGNNISISDPDKTTQVWNVKVELSNAFALDSLFKSGNIGSLTIGNPDYTTIPGKVTITISGTGTGTELASAINDIKFKTGSENPDLTPRIITIDVSDDASPACKVSTVSTVNIKAKNDCPVVDLNTNSATDYTTIFVEQGSKVNVTSSSVSITDIDNTTQNWTAKVELTNAVSLDSLFSSVTVSGFTINPVSYISGKVTVNITGTGTGSDLVSIIKGITYKSGSLNPETTPRTIVISIADDSSCTATANSTITINQVNDASSFTLDENNSALTIKKSDFQTTYTEQTTAVNIGDVDTKITDVDNTTQSSATITLTNKKAGDIIQVGVLNGGITASYDSSQVGKVIITLSGVTTLANYEDAIRNINFQNNRDNVDTTTRVVEATVNDGSTNSNIATSFIKVINVNDTVIVNNETVVTNEDVTITNNLTTITSNDIDPDGDALTVTGIVTSTKNGTINIVGNTYVYDPNKFFFGQDTAVFNVCDTKSACRNDTLFITVNPVSDGLFLDLDVNNDNDKFDSTGYQTTYTENDAHVGIDITDNDVSIFNPDLFDMTTATFILTNKKAGDTLYVNGVLVNGLTSSLVSSGNTLTLTVSGLKDSTAYKNLLTQIQFNNNRDDVDTTTRVINVTVANTDGTSNIAQSLIKVVNINDLPIVENEFFTINEDIVLTNTLVSLLTNDSDPDGDVLSIETIEKFANNGTFSIDGTNYIYNPNKDFNGKDTVIVSVCDTKNACRNDTLFITVLPINDKPILDLDKSNNNDTTLTVNYQTTFGQTTKVSVGDEDVFISDLDNTSIYSALIKLTNTKVGDSLIVNGTLPNGIKDSLYTIGDTTYIALKGKGTLFNYQYAIELVNFQHMDAIIDSTTRVIFVTVNDSLVNSNVAITTISIDNRSPLIVNDVYVTLEDSVLTKTLADILINDKDPEGAKLTVSSTVKNGTNGTFTTDGTNFTYNPKKDFNGKDTVIVSVCDIKNTCTNDTLFITVVPVNDRPLLDLDTNNSTTTGPDYLTHYEENNTGLSIGDVDVEITDVDNTTISSSTIKLVNSFTGDTLIVNGIIPNGITYTTSKIGDTIIVKFEGKGSLVEYQNLIKQTNYSSSKDTLITTDRFVHVTVNDSIANSNIAITTITLENVNDNPIVNTTNLITKEDSTITGQNKDLLVIDKDPEGNKLVIKEVVKDGTNGTFVLTTDSTYSYTPNKDFNGLDTVIVSVCDPQGLCSNKTIIITVIPVNDNPILDLDEDNNSGKTGADYTTIFNENSTSISINDTDISIIDIDSKTIVSSKIILTNTKSGDSLVIENLPNGLIALTSKVGDSTIVNINGTASLVTYQNAISAIKFLNVHDDLDSTTRIIKVTVNDSLSTSNIGTATIKINSINDDPIIKSDTLTVIEDISITKDFETILANDKDPENNILTVTGIVKNGNKGNVIFTDSTFTYNPNLNLYGKDTVVFNVCDPLGACKNDTLFITIIPVNDALIVINNTVNIYNDSKGVTIDFIANDSDIETTVISTGIVNPGKHGKITGTGGVFTYVPIDPKFVGRDTIIYNVCDQGYPTPPTCKEDTIFVIISEYNTNCTSLYLDKDTSSGALPGNYNTVFVENSNPIKIVDTDISIFDLDNKEIVAAHVSLTNTQAYDSLYFDGFTFPNVITTVVKSGGNWEIDFKGLSDTTNYKSLLSNIRFVNKRDDIDTTIVRDVLVTVNDGICTSASHAYIAITPIRDNANIISNYFTSYEDVVYTDRNDTITDNDLSIDGDSLYVSTIITQGKNGTLLITSDSTFSYTPNANFNGKDTMVVSVCEFNKKKCYENYIYFDVIPVADSFIVNSEDFEIKKGLTLSNTKTIVTLNDYNIDGGIISVNSYVTENSIQQIDSSITIAGKLGTLTISKNGVFSYTSTEGLGDDVFIFEVCANGICKKDTLTITVYGVTTGITPNGDGINDYYVIVYPENWGTAYLQVYNRWGSLVYEMDNYLDQWNGTSNRGVTVGNDLPDGTYFVEIKYSKQPTSNEVFSITLLR
jgi:gliding motility-associated-like protein